MTASVDDYLALLPSAGRGQPNFVAFVSALLDGLVEVQNTLASMPGAFDLDNAVGAQLDADGVRIGFKRELDVPLSGVYFSFDTAGVGLDQGVIRGPLDPAEALTLLDDETYRFMLKLKARANAWDGSLGQAQQMLSALASNGTLLFMQDNFDMTAKLGVSGVVPSTLFVSLLKQMKDWVRPAAVDLPRVFVTSASGRAIFGLDVQNNYVAGLDSGAWATAY